jgi:hypothetical protein
MEVESKQSENGMSAVTGTSKEANRLLSTADSLCPSFDSAIKPVPVRESETVAAAVSTNALEFQSKLVIKGEDREASMEAAKAGVIAKPYPLFVKTDRRSVKLHSKLELSRSSADLTPNSVAALVAEPAITLALNW